MGLIIPKGPDWSQFTSNLAVGNLSLVDVGTSVTAGANNIDSTEVGILSALTHDVEYIVLGFEGFQVINNDSSSLLDILVDPAGGTTWQPLIDDLLVGYTGDYSQTQAVPRWYHFPLFIPAGTAIGARARTARAVNITGGKVTIFACGGNANPGSWWSGQSVASIGINPAASIGTLVSSGASAAYGSWADVGSPLARDCGALQFAVQGQGTATASVAGFQFEFGVGGVPIANPVYGLVTSSETGHSTPSGVIFKRLPSGTQIQARGANTTAGAIDFDVAVYAVH